MDITSQQFDEVIEECTQLFHTKMIDYGTAWRILRTSSLTDQIFIKAQRIRSIQEKKEQKIADDIRSEFIGIINYCVMALIQLEMKPSTKDVYMEEELTMSRFSHYFQNAKALMMNKNHDYGEAWRDMRISSLVDIILMKIFRTKQIENKSGNTIASEGIDANYNDMINYAVFAMIKINEGINPLTD